MSVRPSVCLSVCPSLKISVTTKPIGFYSSGPVVVLGYFLGGWDTPNPPSPPKKTKKSTPHFFLNFEFDTGADPIFSPKILKLILGQLQFLFFNYLMGHSP